MSGRGPGWEMADFVTPLTSIAEEEEFVVEPAAFALTTYPWMYHPSIWQHHDSYYWRSWAQRNDEELAQEEDPTTEPEQEAPFSSIVEIAPGRFCWSVGKWLRINRLRQLVSSPFAVDDAHRFLLILTPTTRQARRARLSVKLLEEEPSDVALFYAAAWTEGQRKPCGKYFDFGASVSYELDTELKLGDKGQAMVYFELIFVAGPPPGLMRPETPCIRI